MIVMADFNYDTLKHDQVIKVQNIERSYLLTQIINELTRVTPLSSTIIDHIYVSSHIVPTSSGVLPICISDHFPVFLIVHDNLSCS